MFIKLYFYLWFPIKISFVFIDLFILCGGRFQSLICFIVRVKEVLEYSLQETSGSLFHVGPRDWTQILRLGIQHLYLLSLEPGPVTCNLNKIEFCLFFTGKIFIYVECAAICLWNTLLRQQGYNLGIAWILFIYGLFLPSLFDTVVKYSLFHNLITWFLSQFYFNM